MSAGNPRTRLSSRRLVAIFMMPALIFVISLAGLVAALLVEGTADLFFAIAAGAGLLAAAAIIFRK
ncbi:hypothetical protein [Henriciella marina]|nr:hypothetical protein [Henriciella marina]